MKSFLRGDDHNMYYIFISVVSGYISLDSFLKCIQVETNYAGRASGISIIFILSNPFNKSLHNSSAQFNETIT